MFIDFMGVCFDQIYQPGREVPVHVRRQGRHPGRDPHHVRAPGCGRPRSTRRRCYPVFTHVPGLKVAAPSNPYDAKGLLIQAIRDDDPVIFSEHKMLYDVAGEVPEESYAIPFGEANVVREGDDVTIVAIGRMVNTALEAAERAGRVRHRGRGHRPAHHQPAGHRHDPGVGREHRPARRGRRVEPALQRSPPDIAALVAQEAFGALRAPIQMVTAPHTPVPFADSLEDLYIPDARAASPPRSRRWPTMAGDRRRADPDGHDAQVGPVDGDRQDHRVARRRGRRPSPRATTSATSTPTRSPARWSRRGRARCAALVAGGQRRAAGRRRCSRSSRRRRCRDERDRRGRSRRRRAAAASGDAGRAGRAAAAARRHRRAADLVPDAGSRTRSGGDPVVLVHGFGGDKNSWLFVQQPLAEQPRVHALDLPGHGASGKDVGDGTLASLADTVVGFLDALGIERAHLVGHSLGGAVAPRPWRSATPGRVASLTLLAPAGYTAEVDAGVPARFRRGRRRGASSSRCSGGCSPTRRWSPASWSTTCCATSGSTASTRPCPRCCGTLLDGDRQAIDTRALLDGVDVPVTVVWGAADRRSCRRPRASASGCRPATCCTWRRRTTWSVCCGR